MTLLWLWGPVVLHMGAIFLASSTPDPVTLPGRFTDKLAHMAVYALLGALVARAAAGGLPAVTSRHLVIAVVLSTIYGLTDEWHQSFVPQRTADPFDLIADAIGAFAGALAVLLGSRLLTARRGRLERQSPNSEP